MAPCPQCQSSGTVCIVKKGYKRCGPCTRKNVGCGGNFSEAAFDTLEKKRDELRAKSRLGRKQMKVFMRQLLRQQEEVIKCDEKLEEITRRMDAMVDLEARALGELVDSAPDPSDPEQQVMDFDDDFFLWDDPSLLSYGLPEIPESSSSN